MKIALTGFEAFGTIITNPSQLIIERIALRGNPNVVTDILPVEYERSKTALLDVLFDYRPDVLICLGVAGRRSDICLERVALNIDDCDIPDNDGVHKCGDIIMKDGPAAYFSTLPLQEMYKTLREHNIPVRISNHAGTYLCNHAMYFALHEIDHSILETKCGFIHVPPISENLPLNAMIRAVDLCIDVLEKQLA